MLNFCAFEKVGKRGGREGMGETRELTSFFFFGRSTHACRCEITLERLWEFRIYMDEQI